MPGTFRHRPLYPAVRGPQRLVRGSGAAPGEVQIIGVEGIGGVGTFTPQPSGHAVGVEATGQVGDFAKTVGKLILGVEATGHAAGAEAEQVSKAITGVQAVGSAGGVTVKPGAEIVGVAASGEVGAFAYHEVRKSITGVSGAGQVGAAQSGRLVEISGVEAVGQVGTNTPRLGPQLVGVAATGHAAGVGQSRDEFLTGVQAIGHVGTVNKTVSVPLAGVEATGHAGAFADYLQGVLITGVSAIGLTGGQTTETYLGPIADGGGGLSGRTIINRSIPLPNGKTITAIWLWSNAAYSPELNIWRRNSAGNFTSMISDVGITHAGGSAWQSFTLPAPFEVPDDGNEYSISVYYSSSHPIGVTGVSMAHASGNVSGTVASFSETTSFHAPAVGYDYIDGVTVVAQVGAHIAGVEAIGAAGAMAANPKAFITGVSATGATAGVGQEHIEFLTGVQAIGHVGTARPTVIVAIAGVAATGEVAALADFATGPGLIGVAGIGQVGSMAKTLDREISGVEGVGQVGQNIANPRAVISGVAAQGQTSGVGQEHIEFLTGVQAVGHVGNEVPRVSTTIEGVSAVGFAGSFDEAVQKGIIGVSAIGLTGGGATTELGATGTGTEAGANTYINRGFVVDPGSVARGVWVWSNSPYNGIGKIFRENTLQTSYTMVAGAQVSFSHPGGSQWVFFPFPAPVDIPDDGAPYYTGAYSGSTFVGCAAVSSVRAAGDVDGFLGSGWTVDSEAPSMGVEYVGANVTPNVIKALVGVEAVGHVGTEVHRVTKAIVGVGATGFVGASDGSPMELLVGVQATGQVGSMAKTLRKGITGVEATGHAGSLVVDFTIRRRRVIALAA